MLISTSEMELSLKVIQQVWCHLIYNHLFKMQIAVFEALPGQLSLTLHAASVWATLKMYIMVAAKN